ncbi:MAG: ribosome recycling factor [Anaerolineae bacterium]|nr:ribosome recycling factor [Anaerolineae bacterium]NUQ03149.1 ribosome recycling factor [Anaerolineae bacterium]
MEDVLKEATHKMRSTLQVFEEELSGIRTGRASPALVDRLHVDYYGQMTELRQIATISTPEPMQILIRPFEKSSVKPIEKAIQASDLGINPNVDGESIRLNMPPLTRERRQDLVKFLHRKTEETRVAIRNVRRGSNDDLKEFEKEGMISEDELKRGEAEIQKMTDKFIADVEARSHAKEKEILEV